MSPDSHPTLSDAERLRYARHLVLPEVGEAGQRRLKAAGVLVVGLGGLGCPVATMLAAAGVGRIGLVDADVVTASNLQRQTLFTVDDIGRPKAVVARERLSRLNPEIAFDLHPTMFSPANAPDLFAAGPYDLVVDATDNFEARYAINDACLDHGLPLVFGCIFQFSGRVTVFGARGSADRTGGTGDGPCYRCVFPDAPPPGCIGSCAEAGVLGVLPGIVGNVQAMEAIKWILGIGTPLVGRFLEVDSLSMRFREIRVSRDPACAGCGTGADERRARQRAIFDRYPVAPNGAGRADEITPRELRDRLARRGAGSGAGANVGVSHDLQDHGRPVFVLDVRQPDERRPDDPGDLLVPVGDLPARVEEVRQAIARALSNHGQNNDHKIGNGGDRTRHNGNRGDGDAAGRQIEIVTFCASGVRSRRAVEVLRAAGFDLCRNLVGGIEALRAIEAAESTVEPGEEHAPW